MADPVRKLFDEFAARYARGEDPDAREYLSRAGRRADELARLLDRYVTLRPPPKPTSERIAEMRAWREGSTPLLETRVKRGLKRTDVVDFLLKRFGIDPNRRPKLEDAYHELEAGLLDPPRVSRKLLLALADLLDTVPDALLPRWSRSGPALASAPTMFRRDESGEWRGVSPAAAAAAHRPPAAEPEWDEVDDLFRGGPE